MSSKPPLQKSRFKRFTKGRGKWLLAVAFGLYLSFILISWLPNLAEQTVLEEMDETVHRYLTFPHDGWNEHYYVERYDVNKDAHIDLTYTSSSNTLEVDCENLLVLWIDSRSLYEDEAEKVMNVDHLDDTNYYKKFFYEKNRFNVRVLTDRTIDELKFIDAPVAYNVSVNGEEWWLTQTLFNYTHEGMILSHVPIGQTNVVIYFSDEGNPSNPMAAFTSTLDEAVVNQIISFDASTSYDGDGSIISYEWDFGDGNYSIGVQSQHAYERPGNYGIILTVTDNEYLVARAYSPMTIRADIPGGINGVISDIIVPEDNPPFALALSPYEPSQGSLKSDMEYKWYLTGEDPWLYSVTGENESDSTLLFTLVPNAFGEASFVLWLIDGESEPLSQTINITVTPVNDRPFFVSTIPDLVIHYDVPYTFNYIAYIWDEETPQDQLILTTNDPVHTTVSRTNITYTYPESMLGEEQYVVINLSDGELFSLDVLALEITDDHPPNEVLPLPDIVMYEGESLDCIFNLNDYFQDIDGDPMYFSYGYSHLNITIDEYGCVHITAPDDWNGEELVTFRATDPSSAMAEQTIHVTVLPVNDPPVISGVPDLVVHYDAQYSFDLRYYLSDEDNTTDELTITTSDPDHIRISSFLNTIIILYYPIDMSGWQGVVRITVSDGIEESFQDITVHVTTDWPPTMVKSLPDVHFAEDTIARDVFNLRSHFMDPDLEGIFFSYTHLNINAEIHEDGMVDISAPADWFGIEEMTFRAIDQNGALSEDTIIVTVTPVNDPPILDQIPAQKGDVGDLWVLDLRHFITDVDTPERELSVSFDGVYENIDVKGTDIIIIGEKPMRTTVNLKVSDGELTTEGSMLVVISGDEDMIPTFRDFVNMYWYLFVILIVIGILFIMIQVRRQNNFEIKEAFLLYKNGLLISHVASENSKEGQGRDQEAVSSLLTAIQDFVMDSFSRPGEEKKTYRLKEINFGEHNIFIENSENITLAVLFNGVSSRKMVRRVKKGLNGIVTFYPDSSKSWNGDVDEFAGIERHLLKILTSESVFVSKEKNTIEVSTRPPLAGTPVKSNIKPATPVNLVPTVAQHVPLKMTPTPVVQTPKPMGTISPIATSLKNTGMNPIPMARGYLIPTPRAVPTAK